MWSKMNFLQNLQHRFFRILRTEETFFLLRERPRKLKLTPEFIKMNFGHLAPDSYNFFVYCYDSHYIYMWFTKEDLKGIPEGYLVAKVHSDEHNTIIIQNKNDSVSVYIIKNSVLTAQAVFDRDRFSEQSLDFLQREYSLFNPKIHEIKSVENYLSPLDFLKFFHFDKLDYGVLLTVVSDYLYRPALAFFIIASIFHISYSTYLTNYHENLDSTYQQLKEKNSDIILDINTMEKKVDFWNSFVEKELSLPCIQGALQQILKVAESNNSHINNFEFSGDTITLYVETGKNNSTVIEDLLNISIFSNVKLISTYKSSGNDNKEIKQLDIELKRYDK